jgi:archaellum biogenesis ATPase FlaH
MLSKKLYKKTILQLASNLMEPNLQTTILRNLINNENYTRKVIPFLKKDYFEGTQRIVFDQIISFVTKYNKLPNGEALAIEIESQDISDGQYSEAVAIIKEISNTEETNFEWLIENTEKWCQDRAIYLAIMKSINIIDGKDPQLTKNALPELLSDALSVAFDTNVGHDYIDDFQSRYDFYHRQEERIPFDLDYFNTITKGGLPNKTLNIALAGTGVGKSLFMCHVAGSVLAQGKNALYITMEMAEERIAERVDANLMNTPIDQLPNLSKDMFGNKVAQIANKSHGKLVIKEYPTGSAHVGHFRALMKELQLKKNFKPDVVFIDYLNICASSRMKGMGGAINSYSYIKAIAEEIRGLAVEFDVPIVSATQTTRSGYSNSDVGLEDTSESFGLPATADLMFALISNEELEGLGQILVKQLKNRYNDPSANKRFVIGVDRSKMKLYDVEQSAQNIIDAGQSAPVADYSQNNVKKFEGFKV